MNLFGGLKSDAVLQKMLAAWKDSKGKYSAGAPGGDDCVTMLARRLSSDEPLDALMASALRLLPLATLEETNRFYDIMTFSAMTPDDVSIKLGTVTAGRLLLYLYGRLLL